MKIKASYEKLAKQRMSDGGSGKGVRNRTFLGRTNKHLADRADVKLTKFNQIEYILKNGSEDLKDKLRNGRVTPDAA